MSYDKGTFDYEQYDEYPALVNLFEMLLERGANHEIKWLIGRVQFYNIKANALIESNLSKELKEFYLTLLRDHIQNQKPKGLKKKEFSYLDNYVSGRFRAALEEIKE